MHPEIRRSLMGNTNSSWLDRSSMTDFQTQLESSLICNGCGSRSPYWERAPLTVAKPGELFYTDALDQRAHSSRIKPPSQGESAPKHVAAKGKGIMRDSQHYRSSAAQCLLAAQTDEPCYRKLHLSMAISWLSLARQEEATENPPVSGGAAEPVKFVGLAA